MLSQMEEVATSFNLARESDGEEGGTGGGARSVSCQTTLPRKQGLRGERGEGEVWPRGRGGGGATRAGAPGSGLVINTPWTNG